MTKAQEESEETFRDKETGSDLEVQEKQSLLEWFANNYKQVGHHHGTVIYPIIHCVVLLCRCIILNSIAPGSLC